MSYQGDEKLAPQPGHLQMLGSGPTFGQSQVPPNPTLSGSPPWLQRVVRVRTALRGPVRRVLNFCGKTELHGTFFWAWVP